MRVGWPAIAIGIAIGALVGIYAAVKVKMTAMPQMVALYNGAGGGAAALISTVAFFIARPGGQLDPVVAVSLVLSAIIGAISFAGSIIAFLKLQEVMTGRPVTYPGQQVVNAIVLLAILALGALVRRDARNTAGVGVPRACCSARCCSACSSCCRSAAPTCRSSSRC